MRKFTFSDARSHKFWNIELSGKSFTVTYGRIGTAGRSQTKKFASPAAAKAEHDKLIREKLRKGYVEAAADAAPAPSALRAALEEAIVENPDDLMAHQAYADHLNEVGDPKGEFIQVQLALEDEGKSPAERKKLKRKETALLKKHGREWLGDLAPYLLHLDDTGQYAFVRGWLDSLEIRQLSVNYARALVRSPQAQLLRTLEISYVRAEGENNEYEPGDDVPNRERDDIQFVSLHPLLRSPYLGNVRRFRLGYEETCWDGSFTLGPAAVALIAKMPRIEEIVLRTRGVDLDKLFVLPMQHLRVLWVDHMNVRHPLEKLALNPTLTNLTTLHFHPHHHEEYFPREWDPENYQEFDPEDAYITPAGVQALVRSPHLTGLTRLHLRLSSAGDEGVRAILESGLLKRLKVLDLRHGCVTDEGARQLADCPDVKNLELLDLNRNRLTRAGVRALVKALGKVVRANDQIGPDEDPHQYLFEGDVE